MKMMTYGVVVVEDEYWIRKLICSYLPAEDDGIILLGEASDGFEALSLCRRVRPRILITDIKMPEMNGLELMETIRDELPEIQIIFISGYESFEYAHRALRGGAVDYLLKPIEKQAVRDTLFNAVRHLEDLAGRRRKIHVLETKLRMLERILRPSEEPANIRDQRIKRAVLFIRNNYDRDISLEEAASEAAMSPNYFSECFKKTIGIGFSDYVTARRLRKAAELLRDPKLKISQVARMSGFSDPHYFSRIFKKSTGYNPGQCRNLDEIP